MKRERATSDATESNCPPAKEAHRSESSQGSKGSSAVDFDKVLDAAVRAVAHASSLAVEVQAQIRSGKADSIKKTDLSPVTIADYAVQCLVTQYLSTVTEVGEKLRLVAEEDADLLKEGGRDLELVEVAKLLNDHYPFQEVASLFPGASSPSSFTTADVLRLLQRGGDGGGREGSFWVLDPIDGTKGFLRDAQYAIGLGFIESGSPVLSAMASPNLPPPGGNVELRAEDAGFIFFVSGSQASAISLGECRQTLADNSRPIGLDWHNSSSPLHVAPSCLLNTAIVCESFEELHRDGDAILPELAKRKVLSAGSAVRLDSMSKYGLVARGDAHIYLRGNFRTTRAENIWDHAAGVLLVSAAGGRITDLLGKPLDFGLGRTLCNNRGILAAPAEVHESILSEIAQLSSKTSDHSK